MITHTFPEKPKKKPYWDSKGKCLQFARVLLFSREIYNALAIYGSSVMHHRHFDTYCTVQYSSKHTNVRRTDATCTVRYSWKLFDECIFKSQSTKLGLVKSSYKIAYIGSLPGHTEFRICVHVHVHILWSRYIVVTTRSSARILVPLEEKIWKDCIN